MGAYALKMAGSPRVKGGPGGGIKKQWNQNEREKISSRVWAGGDERETKQAGRNGKSEWPMLKTSGGGCSSSPKEYLQGKDNFAGNLDLESKCPGAKRTVGRNESKERTRGYERP